MMTTMPSSNPEAGAFDGREIEIMVNGFKETVPANATISDLIRFFKENDVHLIVELNGQFIFSEDYSTTPVTAGDRIEFINPAFGG